MELLRDRSEEFFFFSSRRRHTRFDCDWSSDVCSSDLIEESEALDLSNATATHAYLSEMLPGVMVGLLHSRMPTAEKKAVMELFSAGVMGVLVSTTVIEVGVDVPNASLMVIEHAERFG